MAMKRLLLVFLVGCGGPAFLPAIPSAPDASEEPSELPMSLPHPDSGSSVLDASEEPETALPDSSQMETSSPAVDSSANSPDACSFSAPIPCTASLTCHDACGGFWCCDTTTNVCVNGAVVGVGVCD
jgi:hypothetical protein